MVQSSATVRVAQLGLNVTDQALEDLFSDYGPIKRCFVVKPKNEKGNKRQSNKTIGYVEFAILDDAETAIEEISNKLPELGIPGTPITVTSAPDRRSDEDSKTGKENTSRKTGEESDTTNISDNREAAKQKKARLIVRNIPWKSTVGTLRTHFETGTGGKVVDVNILKKKDGKMVGCAFVQLSSVGEAAKAIKQLNGKPFLERPIAVDWAVSKEQFSKGNSNVQVAKDTHNESIDDNDVKTEKEGRVFQDEDAEPDENSEDDGIDDDSNESSENMDESDDSEGPKENIKKNLKENWPKTGHDIAENKTVFLRNISFNSEEDDLRDMMDENFGKVLFARLVVDKVTEHPKGTAFVKFATAESALKCIEASNGNDGLFLDGRQIYAVAALTKEDADKNQQEKKVKEAKDNRNLYLAREGLVRDGTLAAEGVSQEDMAKRNSLSRWKKQMLKDLTMFVSPTRLCVRNLPPHINDNHLKKLMLKFAEEPTAKITESKIMRDFKKSDSTSKGTVGTSKGFGFVTYTTHESALNALRKINNNPLVFKKDQRPIIEFSIENRTAIQAREKRLQKSREKNPLWKGNNTQKDSSIAKHQRPSTKEEVEDKPTFMGSANNPKQKNLPSHDGPKVRHNRSTPKITRRDLKKKEQEKRNPKKRKIIEVESTETSNVNTTSSKRSKPEEKENKTNKKLSRKQFKKQKNKSEAKDFRDEKQFASMVANYKSKLTNNEGIAVKSKWFK